MLLFSLTVARRHTEYHLQKPERLQNWLDGVGSLRAEPCHTARDLDGMVPNPTREDKVVRLNGMQCAVSSGGP